MAKGFYRDQTTALTASFVLVPFGFKSDEWVISNDDTSGSNEVVYSYNGIDVHGVLKPNESYTNTTADISGVYLRYNTGAPNYRITANARF